MLVKKNAFNGSFWKTDNSNIWRSELKNQRKQYNQEKVKIHYTLLLFYLMQFSDQKIKQATLK